LIQYKIINLKIIKKSLYHISVLSSNISNIRQPEYVNIRPLKDREIWNISKVAFHSTIVKHSRDKYNVYNYPIQRHEVLVEEHGILATIPLKAIAFTV